MSGKTISVLVCIYLALVVFNFGAFNATLRRTPNYNGRKDSAVMLFFSLIPIAGTIAALACTGFCEDGFSYSFTVSEKH